MKSYKEDPGKGQTIYRIQVRGRLDDTWSQWFDDMSIACESASDGSKITVLTGAVADQPKLRGILARMWDLNLTVLSVERVVPGTDPARTEGQPRTGGKRWENS